jgi:hypothetical protein
MASTAVSGDVLGPVVAAAAASRGFEKLRLQPRTGGRTADVRTAGGRAVSGSGGRGRRKGTALGIRRGALLGVETAGLFDI